MRVWIDADLAPLATAAVRRELIRTTGDITPEDRAGGPGATTPAVVRIRLLARVLGQLGAEPSGCGR